MELAELMKCISTNNIPHFNIWFGEEQTILDIYLKQISMNKNIVYCETVSDAINQVRRKSLDKSIKLYVVAEDDNFKKAEDKWKEVIETFDKSKHFIVCRYTDINKKYKFYTQNKDIMVEFVHLSSNILTSYIQKDIDLSDDNCDKLCQMCGNDYGRILLEVDKIKHYISASALSANKSFYVLLEEGAIYSEIGDITFELTNAVLGGYPERALQKLDEAKRKGEPAIMIASILYNGFRNLLAYQGLGANKKDAGQRTGLTGWQIKQCIDLSGAYLIFELQRNMFICQKVESGIKMGTIDEEIALDYLVVSCLR